MKNLYTRIKKEQSTYFLQLFVTFWDHFHRLQSIFMIYGVFMATGIARQDCVDEFAGIACTLINKWGSYINEFQRAAQLTGSAFKQLEKFQVELPTFAFETNLNGADGVFSFSTWTVKFVRADWQVLQRSDLASKKKVSALADTIYHEYRHCEQWFRIARWLASGKWTAANIVQTMGIPQNIATAAVALTQTPLSADEQNEASEWYESVYGRATAAPQVGATQTVFGAMNPRDIALGAGKLKRTAGLTGELAVVSNQRQVAQYQHYRDLPEEEDAFGVGGAVQTAIYKSMNWKGSHEKWNHVNARKV